MSAQDAVVKGWRGYRGGDLWGKAKAALDGLAAASYAVVELPEPRRGDWELEWADGQVTVGKCGADRVRLFSEDSRYSAAEARELAAALLAAANKAEAVDDE